MAAALVVVVVVGWLVVCSVRPEFGDFAVLSWLVAVWVADCHGDIWYFLAGNSVFEKSC